MNLEIEEVESSSDEVELQNLAIAEKQSVERPISPGNSCLQIEEIEFPSQPSSNANSEPISVAASSSVSWRKRAQKDSSPRIDERRSKLGHNVFADLPKRLRDAKSRQQSSKSMLSSLKSSTLYNPRALHLTVIRVLKSCGSTYIEAYDDEDMYLVHLPKDLTVSSVNPGTEVKIHGSFTRRRLRNHWLLSMIVSITCV